VTRQTHNTPLATFFVCLGVAVSMNAFRSAGEQCCQGFKGNVGHSTECLSV
jgi:hypothetical protein